MQLVVPLLSLHFTLLPLWQATLEQVLVLLFHMVAVFSADLAESLAPATL